VDIGCLTSQGIFTPPGAAQSEDKINGNREFAWGGAMRVQAENKFRCEAENRPRTEMIPGEMTASTSVGQHR